MTLNISSTVLDSFQTKTRFGNSQICLIKSAFLLKFFVSIGRMQIAPETSPLEKTSAKLLLADENSETPKKRQIQ